MIKSSDACVHNLGYYLPNDDRACFSFLIAMYLFYHTYGYCKLTWHVSPLYQKVIIVIYIFYHNASDGIHLQTIRIKACFLYDYQWYTIGDMSYVLLSVSKYVAVNKNDN